MPRCERRSDLALEVLEGRGADRVGDPVAVALDGPWLGDRLFEALQRDLRAFVVGEVAVRLLEASEVALAVLELLVVGLELPGHRLALEAASGRLRHESRDVADLVLAQLELERGHARAAVLDLSDDLLVPRPDRIQIRPFGAARAGSPHGVAAAAAGVREDLLAVLGVAGQFHVRGRVPATAARGGEGERSQCDDPLPHPFRVGAAAGERHAGGTMALWQFRPS